MLVLDVYQFYTKWYLEIQTEIQPFPLESELTHSQEDQLI